MTKERLNGERREGKKETERERERERHYGWLSS